MKGGGGDCCLCYCQREVRTSSLLCFANRVIKKKVSCYDTPPSELVDLFPSSSPSLQQRTDLSYIVHGWQLINAWRRVRKSAPCSCGCVASHFPRWHTLQQRLRWIAHLCPLCGVVAPSSVICRDYQSWVISVTVPNCLTYICTASERWSIMIEFYSLWSATILKWGDFISHWHKFNSKDNLSSHSALLNIQFCELVAGTSQNSGRLSFVLLDSVTFLRPWFHYQQKQKSIVFGRLLLTWNDKSCCWLDGIMRTDTFLAKHYGDFQTICFFYVLH